MFDDDFTTDNDFKKSFRNIWRTTCLIGLFNIVVNLLFLVALIAGIAYAFELIVS